MVLPLAAEKIHLEGAQYVLRTMKPEVARLDWGGWLANPTTARLLNVAPRRMSEADRASYIDKFDGRTSHLLGIWEKATDTLIGLWAIYVDEASEEFLLNIVVGDSADRHKGAQKETSDLVYAHFFGRLGMKAVRCTVLERNEKMIDYLIRRRWTHIGSAEKPAVTGERPVTVHIFRLTREDWRARFEPGWTEDDRSQPLGRKAG